MTRISQEYRSTEGDFDKHLGAVKFTPVLTGVSGTYRTEAVYQKIGRLLFWYIWLKGEPTVTVATVTMVLPISPSRVPGGTDPVCWGEYYQDTGTTKQSINGTGIITLRTGLAAGPSDYRAHGYYWVD